VKLNQRVVRFSVLMLLGALHDPCLADAAEDQEIGMPSAERDPFEASEQMRAETDPDDTGLQFVPSKNHETVPVLHLRAFIEGRGEEPIALIEVQGHGTYLVRAGDVISFQSGGRHTVLQVEEITRLSVLVQVGTLGERIVVR